MDLATAPTLVTLLDGLCETGVYYLVLDLRELEFLGAAGSLRVLVGANRQFRAYPCWLVLTHSAATPGGCCSSPGSTPP
ncbi:STAS domain-containing protein [Pseudonocardia alni]|uniref:STAS domain-containing protein n=1 Tax=Pseudonocardia alni TaxID=33907 RepID=UPI00386C961E